MLLEVIEQFVVDHERVVHETIDGETIVVQLETGNYYSLRGSAAEIWALLESGRSTDDAAAVLAERYDIDAEVAERATRTLADELISERLLIANDGEPIAHWPVELGEPAAAFAEPSLEKFTDMQGFLLLDPIHETDSAGWPHRKPEGG